jgi:hypothetical protein
MSLLDRACRVLIRFLSHPLLALFILTWALPAWSQSPLGPGAGASDPDEPAFDIPAQPLDTALEAFARTSGVDVLYDKNTAEKRFSSEVKGHLTRLGALDQLLLATGLTARFVRANAVLIVAAHESSQGKPAEPSQAAVMKLDTLDVRGHAVRIGSPDYRQYIAQVSADLERRLNRFKQSHPAPLRVTLELWIGVAGEVTRCEPAEGEGGADTESMQAQIQGAVVADPPPPEMPQPLRFEVRIH